MSKLVDELRKISRESTNIERSNHALHHAATEIDRLERLVGLLREHYTMSYTPELAPRMDELKKQIDEQIANIS